MKNSYIILMFLFLGYPVFSQSDDESVSDCEEADASLIYAYSNIKSAYKANNISHLKHYSERSLKSFKEAKTYLKGCGCQPGFDLAEKAVDLLVKVEPSETYEDGRYFVKKVREIAQESITELNKCLVASEPEEVIEEELVAEAPAKKPATTENNLAALQLEQDRLEQQKLELKRKQQELEQKLANQKEKASKIEKEKLITSYEEAMNSNVNAFNNLLKMYGSATKLTYYGGNKSQLLLKSSEDIKSYYLDKGKTLTEAYLKKLKLCESKK